MTGKQDQYGSDAETGMTKKGTENAKNVLNVARHDIRERGYASNAETLYIIVDGKRKNNLTSIMDNRKKRTNVHTMSMTIVMYAIQDTMMESQNMMTNAHIINMTTVMCVMQGTAPVTTKQSITMLKKNGMHGDGMQAIHEDSDNDIHNIVMNNATRVMGNTTMAKT